MSSETPLKGIRVLELTGYLSGPYAGGLLAALGAEVVKVERPGNGDPFRRGRNNESAYFYQVNAGKKSIAVDLKRPAGIQLVRSLLPHFDVLLENNRPGKLEALGLGPDDCQAINPKLIYASITGFGNGGPLRDRPAYNTIAECMTGIMSLFSDTDGVQLTGGSSLVDLVSGLTAVTGVLAALVGRQRNGEATGSLVETSLYEAASVITIDPLTQFFDSGKSPTRESRHPHAQNFCLQTSVGGEIGIQLSSSDAFWKSFAQAMDRADLVDDPRFSTYSDRVSNYAELRTIVQQEFRKRPREEWEQILLQRDVPFAPIQTLADVASHPQTKWLDLLEPDTNGNTLVRPPWRFGGVRPRRELPSPRLGEHSRLVASQVYSIPEISQLFRDRVLAET